MSPFNLGGMERLSLFNLGGIERVSPYNFGGMERESPYNLGGMERVSPHNLGGMEKVSSYNLGGSKGISPYNLGDTHCLFRELSFCVVQIVRRQFFFRAAQFVRRLSFRISLLLGDTKRVLLTTWEARKKYLLTK